MLSVQQRVDEEHWYRGTAGCGLPEYRYFTLYGPEYVVILAGDHIYKMDYSVILRDHVKSGYKCTV